MKTMTKLRRRLQDADPLAAEEPLAAIEVQRMRQAVLATSVTQGGRSLRPAAILAASVAIALIAASAMFYDPAPKPRASPRVPAARASHRGDTPVLRQLHFSTAGGTRVVWVFNPDFDE